MSTSKHASASIARGTLLTLPLLVSGCLSVSQAAICDGTTHLRDAHVGALLADAGPQSLQTGAALVAALDTGCIDG
jgi:hypothetical protein